MVLPTKENLFKKKVVPDRFCPICCREEETIYHVLWNCHAAGDVWAARESSLQKWNCDEGDFIQLWDKLHQCFNQEKLEEISVILAGICTRRDVKWMPPIADFTKVNFDAAIDQAEKKMGIGVVGRNFKGELLFSVYAVKMFIGPVDLAEANALWRAMEICSDLNIQQVQFEGDAPKVITDICKKGATSSWLGQQVDEIKSLLQQMPDWDVKFVYREGNSVAHELVRRALHMSDEVIWMEEGPSDLMYLIDKEKPCIS
ncbi:uncharacterized protein LOC121249517 [Juglans microcarpa x Juglans regia]|uniref:uncharacterized protein LOC121249517 n=1 Tax=Juglans microcarpa x Juglans regia TaxID=2249226 RepID=UPI001B7E4DFE|nr:uncharacterized protein LOC121249517 [Juglans microcarpa x Juglans regia]